MNIKFILCAFLCLTIICEFGICFPGELAVVVNKSNPVEELSFKELVKIFKAERQFWDGTKVYLLIREPGSEEHSQMLELIYEFRSEDEFKKFWLGKTYRGEVGLLPKVLYSDTSVKKMAEKIYNAIGVISQENVDDTVKVLKIDGKTPADEGYRLRF